MLRIAVTGLTKAGSTRLCNLLRLLFQNENAVLLWSHSDEEGNEEQIPKDTKVIISKFHKISEKIRSYDYLFITYRDLRDISISLSKNGTDFFGTPLDYNNITDYIKQMETAIDMLNKMNFPESIFMRYEDYSVDFIFNLCKKLHIYKEVHEVYKIKKEVDSLLHSKPNFRKTLMQDSVNTSNGISKKYLTHFTKEENKKILQNTQIKDFLKVHNYEF
tara:strand:+ start:1418 stop:2071 length:654 start_codon:yes stop_codon:yes gene_type:complete